MTNAATLFADQTQVLINSHNWPIWGQSNVRSYMLEQRDIYKYIHDQSLRLANLGHTPNEIAADISEPDRLSDKFHARGCYGTLKFNARAVYQRYFGFFDGNPVNLDSLPPELLGQKTVEAIGETEAVLAAASGSMALDDLQWVATLLSHLVFSRNGGVGRKASLGNCVSPSRVSRRKRHHAQHLFDWR
ncbi:MAG: alkyl sulfatase dimerization domain-containing protein [Paracoccaceae bacterium]